MSAQTSQSQATAEAEIQALHRQLLNSWNRRSASDFAALYSENGNQVGFDGSQINGRAEIESHLSQIFADHQTARYVGIVREVRFFTPDVAVLRAVVGMIPPNGTDLNPNANAVQTLVAARHEGRWYVEVFHNTPAAFHGRPEASQALTEELRKLL